MRKANIVKVKRNFNLQLNSCMLLFRNALHLRSSNLLQRSDLNKISELSYLKVFLAWEKFIEDSFIRYLMISKIGNRFKSYINANSIEHAYNILREGRQFPDWTNSNDIVRRSKLYFKNGQPYKDTLNSITTELENMKCVRNAIVHISGSASDKFHQTVRSNVGHLPRNITPGKFLMYNKSITPLSTYFEYYIDVLKVASDQIIRET